MGDAEPGRAGLAADPDHAGGGRSQPAPRRRLAAARRLPDRPAGHGRDAARFVPGDPHHRSASSGRAACRSGWSSACSACSSSGISISSCWRWGRAPRPSASAPSGLRVVARSGERLTADRVIARNLMREIEFYLPLSFVFGDLASGQASWQMALGGLGWTVIFVLFPLFNRDRMRVGDLLAGTWVVRAPKRDLQGDVGQVWEGSPAVPVHRRPARRLWGVRTADAGKGAARFPARSDRAGRRRHPPQDRHDRPQRARIRVPQRLL